VLLQPGLPSLFRRPSLTQRTRDLQRLRRERGQDSGIHKLFEETVSRAQFFCPKSLKKVKKVSVRNAVSFFMHGIIESSVL
jgi:hypothetical protein